MRIIAVDSHNEVLPHWFEESLRHRLPLAIVRIDKHHDMSHNCPVLPAREGRSIPDYLEKVLPDLPEYAKCRLNEANFTCPAFHYRIIGALYHFNPRKERIDAYGRVSGDKFLNTPQTMVRKALIDGRWTNLIIWDNSLTKLRKENGKLIPAPISLARDEFEDDLKRSRFPVVIGFDLDSLCAIGESVSKVAIEQRLVRIKAVLECVSSPICAFIARSQTPRAYVPPQLVDQLEKAARGLMENRFSLLA